MNVPEWFGYGVYAAGALFTFRFAAGRAAWAWGNYPDGGDIATGFFAGLVAALFWPFALAAFGVKDGLRSKGSSFRELMAERVYRVPNGERHRMRRTTEGEEVQ